jgi:hypothetical protein
MTDREAMKLALKALELLTGAWQTFDALDYGDNAIAALKERLADPMREVQRLGQEIEQEYLFHQFQTSDGIWYPFLNQSLYETALADGRNPIRTLYTTPPQRTEQEPDYKLLFSELAEKFALLQDELIMWKKQALFCFDVTAPPQRTEEKT